MQESTEVSIARYCAIESCYCERTIPVIPFPSCFLAYPSGPHWTQFASELCSELNARGIQATTWEEVITGGVLFQKICNAIYSRSFVLAELTELNLNVLFEIGYALATGRDAIVLIDKSREGGQLPILRTKEHCFYVTRDDIYGWLDKYIAHVAASADPVSPATVLQVNGIPDVIERPGTLYYLRPRNTTQVLKVIGDQLTKSPFKLTMSDPFDTSYDDFYHQARQIKESQLVVGVFVTNKSRDAVQLNSSVALLLGLAVGLGKHVLALQELPNDPMLDLGTMIRPFQGEKTARSIVEYWVRSESEALLQATRGNVALGRRSAQASKVRDLFLGQPDAMVDYDLMDYFVKTPQYRLALNGVKQMLIGRKGAGKSATFLALQEELGRRQRAILVSIAPTDFQFEQLIGLLADQYSAMHPAFVYQTFWRHIILTEVLRVIADRYTHFLQSTDQPHVERILAFIRESEDALEGDFATRAIAKLDALQGVAVGQPDLVTAKELERVLLRARLDKVEKDLQRLAKDYPIFILADDIDKHWDPSSEASVRLLLGLINEASQLYSRFKGSLNIALFLRQDIFEVLRHVDEELVKRNIANLRWDESELLQMIAERIRYKTDSELDSDEEIWTSILPSKVDGQTGWEYMISRSLMRPRDLLQFCQYAIEKAQAHRHVSVQADDVMEAERDYSEYMFQALRLEYIHVYPKVDQVIFEFVAWRESGTQAEAMEFIQSRILAGPLGSVEWIARCEGQPIQMLRILYDIGFCGVGDRERGLLYYSFERPFEEAIALCHLSPFVAIHPAFHRALELNK